jgi:hypothetical protein
LLLPLLTLAASNGMRQAPRSLANTCQSHSGQRRQQLFRTDVELSCPTRNRHQHLLKAKAALFRVVETAVSWAFGVSVVLCLSQASGFHYLMSEISTSFDRRNPHVKHEPWTCVSDSCVGGEVDVSELVCADLRAFAENVSWSLRSPRLQYNHVLPQFCAHSHVRRGPRQNPSNSRDPKARHVGPKTAQNRRRGHQRVASKCTPDISCPA